MKTTSKFIILAFFLGSAFLSQSQTSIKIDTLDACPGDTILIPVNAISLTDVAAVSLAVVYNPAVLTMVGLENVHPQLAGMMFNVITLPSPQIRLGWFTMGSSGANIGTAKMLDIKMVYHGGAVNLTFDPSSELADNNFNVIPAQYKPGRVQNGQTPVISQQPQSVFVCNGVPAGFSLQSSNTLGYEWEILSGNTWIPLVNNMVYSGVNTSSLTISAATPSMHLNQFRCKLDNYCDLYSDVVTLHVSNPTVNAGQDDTICFGGNTLLSATVSGGFAPFNYQWTPGGAGAAINVSPGATQLYQIQVTDSIGCVATDQVQVVVSHPVTSAGANDTICSGASKIILAQTTGGIAPYNYTWQHGGNQPQTMVTPTAGQTYTVNVTDFAGCASSASVYIEVSHPAVNTGNDDTLCITAQKTITAAIAGGYAPYQYSWSNAATSSSIVVSPVVHTTYSVTITDKFSCTASDQMVVKVSNPMVQVNPNDTICLGMNKSLTASTTGGFGTYQYLWSTAQVSPTIVVAPATQTTYTVSVTDIKGCPASASTTVFVSNPVIDAGLNDTICIGSQKTITSTKTGGYAPFQYAWSQGGTAAAITVSPTINTVYKVTLTDVKNCTSIDSVRITVSNPSVAAGLNDTICKGATATLTAVPSGGISPLGYLWSNTSTQASQQVSPMVNTTYTVTLTDAKNCQATASKAVIVSNPVANAGGDQSACVGEPVTFNGTVSGGFAPYAYTWNNIPGQLYQVTITVSTPMIFKVTDRFNCQATDTAQLTAWPNPVITPIPDDTACYNTAAPLTANASGGTGTLSYLWSTNATTQTISPVITSNTTFWVRATDVNNCKASDTILVLVSNPTVNIGANDTLCKGTVKPVTASINGGFSPFTYAWSTGATATSINVTVNSDTCIMLNLTDKVGCIAKDTVCTIISKIVASAGADQAACIGTPLTFNGTATLGFPPYTYTWNNNPGQSYQITTTANTNMIFKAVDKFNCQATDTALLTAWPNPVITPIPDDTACYNTAAPLTANATGGTGTKTYLWSTNATTQSISPIITSNTTFWVRATDVNNCKASDTILVLVSNPTVNIGANDTLCKGAVKPVSASINGGFSPYTYAWSTGATATNINVTVNSDTCIMLNLTDKVGCIAKDTVCTIVSKIVANAGADQAACIGTPVTFNGTATLGFPPYTYTWNNNPGQSYQITTTTNTNMIFKAVDKFNCQATDTALLTAWPNPVITPIPDDTACFNTAAPLTANATGGTGTLSYLWSTNATTQSISPIITANTTFWVRATDINNCKGTDTITVLVSNPAVSLGNDDTLCLGQVKALTGQITGGFTPYGYNWSTGATTSQINVTGINDTCISLTLTDKVGCVAKDTVCYTVDFLYVDAGADVTQCPGAILNLAANATGGFGNLSYLWSTGAATQNTIANPKTDSLFIIQVTDGFGCTAKDSMEAFMHPVPMPNLGPDDTMCINHVVTLDAGAGFTSYLWSTGATTQTIVLDGAVLGAGTFTYIVTVTNSFGCENADTLKMMVDPCIGIDDPLNTFHVRLIPNPAKDWFDLYYYGETDFTLQIFTATGEEVYMKSLSNIGAGPYRTDVHHLVPGVYYTVIRGKASSRTVKMVVW